MAEQVVVKMWQLGFLAGTADGLLCRGNGDQTLVGSGLFLLLGFNPLQQ
jgi:hypothetical protein